MTLALLDPASASSPSGTQPAQQPFTRRAHAIDDQLLPQHHPRKHHVDIRVLDALVRRLEGWHRPWIALEIRQLAWEAGVSQASVTRALARLEAAGVILRRKKSTKRGRYIWEIALSEAYRTSVAPPALSIGPPHVTMTCQDDVPCKESLERNPVPHHHGAHADDEGAHAAEGSGPPEPRPNLLGPSLEPASADTSTPVEPTGPSGSSAEAPRAQAQLLSPTQNPEQAAQEIDQTAGGRQLTEPAGAAERLSQLVEIGVRPRMAERLVRKCPGELIDRELAHLPHRLGVRDPARYLVAAILDGNFAPPELGQALPADDAPEARAERIRHEHEQVRLRREQQEQAERAQREEAERQAQAGWSQILALPQEVRERLIAQARAQAPRMAAQAAWDEPGPLRGVLLNLYEDQVASARNLEVDLEEARPSPLEFELGSGPAATPQVPGPGTPLEPADHPTQTGGWSQILALTPEAREGLIAQARAQLPKSLAQTSWEEAGPLRGAILNVYAETFAPEQLPALHLPDLEPQLSGRGPGWTRRRPARRLGGSVTGLPGA